jgi:hypothetical protein
MEDCDYTLTYRERLHGWLFERVYLYRRIVTWYDWHRYIRWARSMCAEQGHDWQDVQITNPDGTFGRIRECSRCDAELPL